MEGKGGGGGGMNLLVVSRALINISKSYPYICFHGSWDGKVTHLFPLPSPGKTHPMLGQWREYKLAFSKFNIPNFFFIHFSTVHLTVILTKSHALFAFC